MKNKPNDILLAKAHLAQLLTDAKAKLAYGKTKGVREPQVYTLAAQFRLTPKQALAIIKQVFQ